MRHRLLVCLSMFVLAMAAAAAQRDAPPEAPPDRLLGTWLGSWDGAGGAGGFELTLERSKDGPLSGRVSVTGEPEYKATLTEVAFDGGRMTAKYDFPPDESGVVILTASFEDAKATGTWSLREKATGNEVANGGWKVAKQAR